MLLLIFKKEAKFYWPRQKEAQLDKFKHLCFTQISLRKQNLKKPKNCTLLVSIDIAE